MKHAEQSRYIKLIKKFSHTMEPLPVTLQPEWEILEPKADTPVLTGIKAVLFDLYGTLFVSGAGEIAVKTDGIPDYLNPPECLAEMEQYFRLAVKIRHEAARAKGSVWPEVLVEEIWADYRGKFPDNWDAPQKMRQIREKIGLWNTFRSFGKELALHYELAVNPVYPMPHAEKTIISLAAAGIKLGIISNAQFYSPLLFNAFFNQSPEKMGFDRELSIYSYEEQEAKPSTRLFTKARDILAKRNIKPEETLYIGNDMRNDIIPATAVGFSTALFAGDRRSLRLREDDPACTDKKPGMILRDLSALVRSPV